VSFRLCSVEVGAWEDGDRISAAVVEELNAVEAAEVPKLPRPASREGKALAVLARQPFGMSLAEWIEGVRQEVYGSEAKGRELARKCVDRLVKRKPPCVSLDGDKVTTRGTS
jgi:hypothetical protein